MTKELFKKTTGTVASSGNVEYGKPNYERITISLDIETSKMLELFIREVRDATGFKVAKSDIIRELIKLIPDLNLIPFYLASQEDIKNQFDIIRKKLLQLNK